MMTRMQLLWQWRKGSHQPVTSWVSGYHQKLTGTLSGLQNAVRREDKMMTSSSAILLQFSRTA